MEIDSTPADHKLCGFLRTVLLLPPPHAPNSLPPNTPCHIFADGPDVGFKAPSGVILSIINPNATALITGLPPGSTTGKESSIDAGTGISTPTLSSRNKRLSRIGLVNGSRSVVHQLHALVMHKCLKVTARVVSVVGGEGEVRVVVLVDVYLPIEVWSGWQFSRSKSIAAALFQHLSCDWEARSFLLESCKVDHVQNDNVWDISDCHVLGCNQHCCIPDASKKKLFELHEIFKSLPSVSKKGDYDSSRVNPENVSCTSGLWVLSDDVLINILTALGPLDLLRISSTCRHLRFLAASIMPCMKLKLFPHQQAAVEWMLQRERDSEVMLNPLYRHFITDDGFVLYINTVSGEVVTGTVPTIKDFRGGLFCDEPGLGKTITALSLILKTQGTWADPPEGLEVIWCKHNGGQKCGYYELSGDTVNPGFGSSPKKVVGRAGRRGLLSLDQLEPGEYFRPASFKRANGPTVANSTPATCVVPGNRSWTRVKRNLLYEYEGASRHSREKRIKSCSQKRNHSSVCSEQSSLKKQDDLAHMSSPHSSKRSKKATANYVEYSEMWVQCDACHKWRRLADRMVTDTSTAWFCSMNSDSYHQNCSVAEESWDFGQSITYFPGFYTKGTSEGQVENVSFFTSVLKDHYALMNTETKKALTWLAKLSPDKLLEMGTTGVVPPPTATRVRFTGNSHDYHKIFQAFGLIKRVEQGKTRWHYPKNLINLAFDLSALRSALCEPLDSLRLYLSRATLVVVPSNLVDHWKTQIEKHVRYGQLRVYLWTDHKKPSAHILAWDYDVVITTFSRLSAEWRPRKRSVLLQVHWLRVIFDEGHTLGSSVNLTNRFQISLSLTASSRWLLTGTPTPNTPNSQLSHLHPMLKFLREEAYGWNQNSWDAGILRPFEAEMEEGRSRLLQLLHRCMISARKSDLQMIPPCIKKVTFLNFTEEHAKSYNELVVTVRRNILMADWNDPSHVESLLNPKQWKFRSTTIRNVRLSCCVAGHIKVTEAGEDIQETMDILVEGGLDPSSVEHAFIKYNLIYGGDCMRCKEWCRLPVITPCRHLLCLDCVALDSEKCTFPGCGNSYEMQSPETLARPENPNPKWPVPKDLIELQPSYKQDDWHPDWQSTSSSKVAYLVHRLKELQEANKPIGYSTDEGNDDLLPPFQKIETCSRSSYESSKIHLEKVLIFTQFLEHIHVIEQQLTVAGIKFAGMYSPMHSGNKMKSLAAFQHDAECMALLMDGSAALGLDLSFVTHVFLMEPIWDKSMEEQVISRAHRMGATRPIHVETLAMHGTIEQQMLKFLQDADECRRFLKEEFIKHDREGTKAPRTLHDFAENNYLVQLSFARTTPRKEGELLTA